MNLFGLTFHQAKALLILASENALVNPSGLNSIFTTTTLLKNLCKAPAHPFALTVSTWSDDGPPYPPLI